MNSSGSNGDNNTSNNTNNRIRNNNNSETEQTDSSSASSASASTSLKVRQFIYAYDLSFVEPDLKSRGWNEREIIAVCRLYKNYMLLRYMYPDLDFPPSKEIDLVWRIHILRTKEYRQFCDVLFGGEYLDRTFDAANDWGKPVFQSLYKTLTQELYVKQFGSEIGAVRPKGLLNKIYRKIVERRKIVSLTILVTIFGTAYTIISTHNSYIDDQYNELIASIRNFSADLEEVGLICSEDLKNKHPKLYIEKAYKLHTTIRKNFLEFLNVYGSMEEKKILSKKAHDRLKQFSQKLNKIYYRDINLCDKNFSLGENAFVEREKLAALVWNERVNYLWLYPFWKKKFIVAPQKNKIINDN